MLSVITKILLMVHDWYIPFVAAIIGISLAITCLVQLVTIKFANYASGFVMVCVLNAFFWLGDGLSGSHSNLE